MSRKTLLALAGVAIVILLIAFAWLPLERSRARLNAELPAMRTSIAVLERNAEEARRLRSLVPAPSARNEPLASVATAAGGKPVPGAQIAILDARTLVVSGGDVAFGALLEWLQAVQAAQGLRVETARIEALPAPGRVRAELRLSRS